jgi:sulfur-oxidizing protein SoxZ
VSGGLNAPRLRAPRSARAGEVVEIRALVEHPMETGIRTDGRPGPARDMLTRMTVRVNGEVALQAELRNGMSPNPYHVVFLRIERTSEVEFVFADERGRTTRASARIAVG